jgi:hypothetical protein
MRIKPDHLDLLTKLLSLLLMVAIRLLYEATDRQPWWGCDAKPVKLNQIPKRMVRLTHLLVFLGEVIDATGTKNLVPENSIKN